MISKLWKEQKHPTPKFINDRSHKAFEIYLPGLEVDLSGAANLMGALTGKIRKKSVTEEVTEEVVRLLKVISGTMKRSDIQKRLKLKHDEHFRSAYILPALKIGLVEMTIPDKPNSRLQRYKLTDRGKGYIKKRKSR